MPQLGVAAIFLNVAGHFLWCCNVPGVQKFKKRENLYAGNRIFDFTVQVFSVQKLMKSHFCMLAAELLRAATLTEPTKIHELKLLYAANLCAKSSII